MANEIETGGPAFPQKEPLSCDSQGMDLRDYFAAKALQGILAADAAASLSAETAAAWAYQHADAMLAAR